MDNLPKRNNVIYKVIEGFNEDYPLGFEDYEYTNCIAYEMAIRNDEFKKLIIECDELIEKDEFVFFDNPRYSLIEKLKDYGINYFEYYKYNKDHNNSNIARDLRLELAFSLDYKTRAEIMKIEKSFIYNLDCEEEQKKKKLMRILKDGYIYQEESKKIIETFFQDNNLKINYEYFRHKRPKIDFANEFDISLNLNIPKDELIAYISKIKDEYDKDNSIIKSPLELLGEKNEKSDNKALKKSKLADMFFIYDYHKVRKKDKLADIDIWSEIDTELSNYHDSIKENYYSEKTYKNIKKEMKSFIDNLGYKELITGTTYKG